MRAELSGIVAVYAGLFAFGLVYNQFVAWMDACGYVEGYTSLVVAGGVLVTLAGVAVLDYRAAALALGAFVTSGAAMICGSVWRYMQRRAAGVAAYRHEVLK